MDEREREQLIKEAQELLKDAYLSLNRLEEFLIKNLKQ